MNKLIPWVRLNGGIIAGSSAAGFILMLVGWFGYNQFQNTPESLHQGTVVQHVFRAQYEETHDGGTYCVSYDKSGFCKLSLPNPDIHHTHCIGGCRWLEINGCSNDRRGKEHCRNEKYSVDDKLYEDCLNGYVWYRDEGRCSE